MVQAFLVYTFNCKVVDHIHEFIEGHIGTIRHGNPMLKLCFVREPQTWCYLSGK